jgi:hypothetical protein
MKEISEKISDFIYGNRVIMFDFTLLKKINISDLIIYNFNNYPMSYVSHNFLYATKRYWEGLNYSDWENVLKDLETNIEAVQTLIIFIEKHFQIDSLVFLERCQKINVEFKTQIFNYFDDKKAVLSYKGIGFETQLKKYGLSLQSFDEIRLRLIKEGAVYSTVYEPKSIKNDDIDIVDLSN